MNKNVDLLVSNGGYINLTDNWAKSLQTWMGFVKERPVAQLEFNKQKKDFLMDIGKVFSMDQMPPKLIVNFDQTGIS